MADAARLFLFLTSSTCFVSKYFSHFLQCGSCLLTSSLGLAGSCAETGIACRILSGLLPPQEDLGDLQTGRKLCRGFWRLQKTPRVSSASLIPF